MLSGSKLIVLVGNGSGWLRMLLTLGGRPSERDETSEWLGVCRREMVVKWVSAGKEAVEYTLSGEKKHIHVEDIECEEEEEKEEVEEEEEEEKKTKRTKR